MKYNKINIIDDKLIQHEPVVKMYRGAESCSNMVAAPVGGSINQSQIQFNINCTPSNYFDRRPMIKTSFTVPVSCYNGTAGTILIAQNLTVAGTDVQMSAYPASNLFGISSCDINGVQICSYDMGKYASSVLKLSNVSKNMKKTTCASCPELSFAQTDDAMYTLSNSQGNFNDSTTDYIPNGAWTFKAVANNTVTGANLADKGTQIVYYTIESYEPLILPPFIWNSSSDAGEGIFGMNSLLITLNINQVSAGRAVRTLAHPVQKQGVNLSVVGPVVINSCELHYKTYRPPQIADFKLPSPQSVFHTYNFYNNFISSSAGAFTMPIGSAAGTLSSSNLITMSNVVSTGMPSLIVLWCDKPANLYASNQAKYNYPISKLSIDLGTNQSMLSNYDITDLYRLSEECGLDQSYLSYIAQAYTLSYAATGVVATSGASMKQLVGGPVILRPSVSFPLPAEVTTGSSGSFTWQFQATCSTINIADSFIGTPYIPAGADAQANPAVPAVPATNIVPNLNIMMVYDTWVSIDTSTLQCAINKSFLTVPEVLGASKSETVPMEDVKSESGGALATYRNPSKLSSRIRK